MNSYCGSYYQSATCSLSLWSSMLVSCPSVLVTIKTPCSMSYFPILWVKAGLLPIAAVTFTLLMMVMCFYEAFVISSSHY